MKREPLKRPLHGGEPDSAYSSDRKPLLDFSVNLNFAAPEIPDETWLAWKRYIREYPPSSPREIERRLANCLRIPSENLLVTSGGNEALHAALSIQNHNTATIPTPCFSEYPHLAKQLGYHVHWIPRAEAQCYDPEQFLDFSPRENSTVILANPNNPTGVKLPADLLVSKIQISSEQNIHWVVDEAFIEFTPTAWTHSLLNHLDHLPNLTVVGSLTKTWNIPGLRIGFLATGNRENLLTLRERQLTWPLNGLAHAWADTFLKPVSFSAMVNSLSVFHRWRLDFQEKLRNSCLVTPLPSDSNFFLCRVYTDLIQPIELYRELLKRSVHVRRCDTIPGLEGEPYLRFAVRPPRDTERLIDALNDIDINLETAPPHRT